MPLYGKGMLITFTEVPPAGEDDFNEWYTREHIDERVWMPGFHRARRYIDADGGARIKYFATYETDRAEDLSAPEYMARLADQTDWSKRVMAGFSKFERLTCRVTIDLTHGIAGACAAARFFPADAQKDALRRHLAERLLPDLVARSGMIGACLVENDIEVSNAGLIATGKAIPAGQRQEWVVLLEGATTDATSDAVHTGFGEGLPAFGMPVEAIEVTNGLFMFGNNR
jgi:hypothetical protein